MSAHTRAGIGNAGRKAHGIGRMAAGRQVTQRTPAFGDGPLPLLQRSVDERQAEQHENEPADSAPAEGTGTTTAGAGEIEREREMPTPQDVAERVYRLFMQEVRHERERYGRR